MENDGIWRYMQLMHFATPQGRKTNTRYSGVRFAAQTGRSEQAAHRPLWVDKGRPSCGNEFFPGLHGVRRCSFCALRHAVKIFRLAFAGHSGISEPVRRSIPAVACGMGILVK